MYIFRPKIEISQEARSMSWCVHPLPNPFKRFAQPPQPLAKVFSSVSYLSSARSSPASPSIPSPSSRLWEGRGKHHGATLRRVGDGIPRRLLCKLSIFACYHSSFFVYFSWWLSVFFAMIFYLLCDDFRRSSIQTLPPRFSTTLWYN